MVGHGLRQAGYTVLSAMDGQTALRVLYEKRPDLIILDVMLPDPKMNGYTVCRRIREVSVIPVIMLTAQTDPDDIVQGLDAGADDYVLKPYNKDVLLARVRANLRRAASTTEPLFEKKGIAYSDGFLTVNLDERRVLREGRQVKLSPTEFNLLVKLIENSPRVVGYRDLLNSVWGFEYADDIDYLRVYVWHLRRKLERDPKNPVYIANELGVGYRFEKQGQ
jgi:two-component system KDP operon response regulator KdpE